MAGEKRQITRNRVSYSCQRCRQRKVKCDKVHPVCGACQKTDEECVYTSNENEQQVHIDGNTVETANGRKRKQSPTELARDGNGREDTSQGASNLDDQLLKLSLLLNQLGDVASVRVPSQNGLHQTGHVRTNILTPESQSNRDDIGLAIETEPTQHVLNSVNGGTTSEQHQIPNLDNISAKLEQLTNLLCTKQFDLNNRNVCEISPVQHEDEVRRANWFGDGTALYIPSEQQRNVLFRCWLSSVYPVLPIIDPSLVLMKYRAFHFWYMHAFEKGLPNPCEEYVPLIYAIYYAGLVSMSLRGFRKWFPGASRQTVLASMRRSFLYTLKAPPRLLSSSATLAARVMMLYMSAPNRRETNFDNTAAPLVKAAYSANLHREKPNESLEKADAEVNRRLWWEVVIIDTLEAISGHTPPSINHHFSDIYMPSEMKDTKHGTLEASRYLDALQEGKRMPDRADDPSNSERLSMTSVINLVAKARTILVSSARRLLNINLAAKPKTKEDMVEIRQSLEEVDHYIKSMIDRIPAKGLPELSFTPDSNKPGQSISFDHGNLFSTDLLSLEVEAMCGFLPRATQDHLPYLMQYRNSLLTFHKYARILLSMLVDQLYCFSYYPFLSNAKRKMWISARQCALKHAHSCIRKFNVLASDIELERFRWTLPAMYHPIHACLIILLDTYEQPKSREAPRSRALLDEMLSRTSPEFGIVGGDDGITDVKPLQESGNEAFAMLMQLRTKAWQKAGLDPFLLWTEQDQIDVGVATPLTEADRMAQSLREDVVLPNSSANTSDHQINLFRATIRQRATERFHPADMGPPDEADTLAPTTWVKNLDSNETATPRNGTRFHRARPDQQPIPIALLAHTNPSNTTAGHAFNFKPPSSLYDMGTLIRKIKSYQQSKNPDTAAEGKSSIQEDSSNLSQQLTTTNNNLTNFMAENFPENPSNLSTDINSQDTVTETTLPPFDPTPITTAISRQPNDDIAAETQEPAIANENDNENTAMDVDFDWDKWDAIFGHIMDDEFAENDVHAAWADVRHEEGDMLL